MEIKLETSWVSLQLQQLVLLDESLCTLLMKCVRNTLISTTDRVIVYEILPNYASLFLTNEEGTIFFYNNLQCSKIRPPVTSTIRSLSFFFTHHTKHNPVLDIEWITTILAMDHKSRYESDKDLLELSSIVYNESESIVVEETREREIEIKKQIENELSSVKRYEPELVEKIVPKTIYVSLEDEDKDDQISVKSYVSSTSTKSSSIVQSYRKPSLPIPLGLRPKWKR